MAEWLAELGGGARYGTLVRPAAAARLRGRLLAWHGSRSALASDARRCNRMVIGGWLVLRFTYEDVMFHPDEVREVLLAAVALPVLLRAGAVSSRRSGRRTQL